MSQRDAPPSVAGPAPPGAEDALERTGWRRLRRIASGLAFSLVLHAVVLALFGTIMLHGEIRERISTILATREDEIEPDLAFTSVETPETLDETTPDSEAIAIGDPAEIAVPVPVDAEFALDPRVEAEANVLDGPAINLSDATSGRSAGAKAALLEKFGGNSASEAAVNSGLKWLASIQRKDGSWSFREIGGAPNPGTVSEGTEMGATASALLCYLGAGHTHRKAGPYRDTVRKGLDFLLEGRKNVPAGGDFRGPIPNESHAGMYIQGLVTIALAEAHAMTKDRGLRLAATSGAQFIVAAQDPRRGGWRYAPGTDSDTSVVGWQLMALKSAQAARIRIPPRTFADVSRFLDSVAADDGAKYGYTGPQTDRPSTTAIGLLCRMYLGWDHDTPALATGIRQLAERGPDFNDLYYTYYATQAVHHWGGDDWKRWNEKTRDGLVARQVTAGGHAGSWNPGGTYSGQQGGRLFDTCLAIMTLEVYYRHLPLYERQNLKVEF